MRVTRIWDRSMVHPRVCGEHAAGPPAPRDHGGSSPRVRGTRQRDLDLFAPDRFIPACAGNTFWLSSAEVDISVHPRVCGEHDSDPGMEGYNVGSSPRVRGTHHRDLDLSAPHRFIPACAGNTRTAASRSRKTEVHPRVCGEHWGSGTAASCRPGSSPRVRGTPLQDRLVRAQLRFIPACAGNTLAVSY